MKATSWIPPSGRRIEFIFLDGPHPREAQPELFAALHQAGIYDDREYRDWGLDGADAAQRVAASLELIEAALLEHEPVHALAGVCDGALAAALTVSALESRATTSVQVPALVNFCGPSIDRAPSHLRDALSRKLIRTPSVHICGRADEQLTRDELLSLPSVCEKAVSLWHG